MPRVMVVLTSFIWTIFLPAIYPYCWNFVNQNNQFMIPCRKSSPSNFFSFCMGLTVQGGCRAVLSSARQCRTVPDYARQWRCASLLSWNNTITKFSVFDLWYPQMTSDLHQSQQDDPSLRYTNLHPKFMVCLEWDSNPGRSEWVTEHFPPHQHTQ